MSDAGKAADEVRDALMHPMNERAYNQGVDDAVEAMLRRWVVIEELQESSDSKH